MTKALQHRRWISGTRQRAVNGALALAVFVLPTVVVTQSIQAQSFSVLYSFTLADGVDAKPGLVRDKEGNLYGTTHGGGLLNCVGSGPGCGVVFKLDTTGTETVLHSFSGGADGARLNGGLVQDKAGNLYGTTSQNGASGVGTVFKLTP